MVGGAGQGLIAAVDGGLEVAQQALSSSASATSNQPRLADGQLLEIVLLKLAAIGIGLLPSIGELVVDGLHGLLGMGDPFL